MNRRHAHRLANRTVRRQIDARTAAPEGGARNRKRDGVRGCVFFIMLAGSALAQDVPSGQPVTLHEVLVDTVNGESWLRFRFLAPQIAREGGDVSYGEAEGDFQELCETVGLPYLTEYDLAPDLIVIALMDRPVPFGQPDPEATQFIEAFRIVEDGCVWEAF